MDPLAEQDRRTSPYAYGFDDPIKHIDPDGMFGEDFGGDGEEEGGPGPKSISLSKATQPTGSRAGNIFKNTLKASGAAIVIGLGPEDPIADVIAGGILAVGSSYALGVLIYDHLNGPRLSSAETQSNESKPEKQHGNKLDDKPAERYTLKDRNTGEVKKHGETTRGEDRYGAGNQKRYSKKELKEKDVDYVKEKSGTKKDMHREQHEEIIKHKKENGGKRPEYNKSDY